jgi:hypothetical protein
MSAMRLHKSSDRHERDERDEPAAKRPKRRKAFVVYATADGEVKISPDALSYLGTVSPFFARHEAREAQWTDCADDSDEARKTDGTNGADEARIVHAPSTFVLKCIAAVTSFVEWQQLDEGELKREYQARVAAMVRALSACPFDQTHVLRLGMADGFRDMEATLVGHDGGLFRRAEAPGAYGATGPDWYRGLTPECAGRLVGVTFPKTSGPSETRARAVLCAFYVVKNRGAESPGYKSPDCKFREIALCPRHFEIRHEANVYDDITESLVVRGRDSRHGCAIRGIEVIHGLVASAIIDLAEIDRGTRDERKTVSYKDTATVLGIMRIQKARLQNTAPLLVEFLDAVALELANV